MHLFNWIKTNFDGYQRNRQMNILSGLNLTRWYLFAYEQKTPHENLITKPKYSNWWMEITRKFECLWNSLPFVYLWRAFWRMFSSIELGITATKVQCTMSVAFDNIWKCCNAVRCIINDGALQHFRVIIIIYEFVYK